MFKFFNRSEPELPEFIQKYKGLNFKAFDKVPIDNSSFIVLDCETTGLGKKDIIITLGAVKLKEREIHLREILDIVFPLNTGSKESEIHGELGNQQEESVYDREILSYIKNYPIVGHHISFDISKLNQMFQRRYKGFKLKNRILDTMKLYDRLHKHEIQRMTARENVFQLDSLCTRFKIPIENRHTALGDAYMTALLFTRLTSLAQDRGIKLVGDL